MGVLPMYLLQSDILSHEAAHFLNQTCILAVYLSDMTRYTRNLFPTIKTQHD